MYKINLESNSTKDTLEIGKKLAKLLSKGDVIVLSGELGAGKTKFVEGFLENFELQHEISSPTFNIVNEYSTSEVNIYHFDVYRLEDSDEFYAIGGEEYFENGICLIEWGEIIQDVLPQNYINISIAKDSSNINKRFFEFSVYGNSEKYVKVLENLK